MWPRAAVSVSGCRDNTINTGVFECYGVSSEVKTTK